MADGDTDPWFDSTEGTSPKVHCTEEIDEEKELDDIIMQFRNDPTGYAREILERAIELDLHLMDMINEVREEETAVEIVEVCCNDDRWIKWDEKVHGIQYPKPMSHPPQKVPEHFLNVLERPMEYNNNNIYNPMEDIEVPMIIDGKAEKKKNSTEKMEAKWSNVDASTEIYHTHPKKEVDTILVDKAIMVCARCLDYGHKEKYCCNPRRCAPCVSDKLKGASLLKPLPKDTAIANLQLLLIRAEVLKITDLCHDSRMCQRMKCWQCGNLGHTKATCSKVFCFKCKRSHNKIEECQHKLERKATNEVKRANLADLLRLQNKLRAEVKKKLEEVPARKEDVININK